MKDFPKFQEIQQFQSGRKSQIVDSFVVPEDKGAAQIISKGDFEEAYPLDKFEVYSIQALTKFREDLMKAEGENYNDEKRGKQKRDRSAIEYNGRLCQN